MYIFQKNNILLNEDRTIVLPRFVRLYEEIIYERALANGLSRVQVDKPVFNYIVLYTPTNDTPFEPYVF